VYPGERERERETESLCEYTAVLTYQKSVQRGREGERWRGREREREREGD